MMDLYLLVLEIVQVVSFSCYNKLAESCLRHPQEGLDQQKLEHLKLQL